MADLVVDLAKALAEVSRVFEAHGLKPPKYIMLESSEDGLRFVGETSKSAVIFGAGPADPRQPVRVQIAGYNFIWPTGGKW